MITVEEALSLVIGEKRNFGIEEVDLLHCVGRVVAIDVLADRDFPPFDRVSMDGIAIDIEAYNRGQQTFEVTGIQAAGTAPIVLSKSTDCIEVMTGAVLPLNTNTVIPYEQCEIRDGIAVIKTDNIRPRQNIHPKGSYIKLCGRLIEKYQTLSASSVGILATVGISKVPVLRLPKVAVCSTGDELVDVTQQPGAHQIRRSNSAVVASALLKNHIDVTIDHLADNAEFMARQLQALARNHDVIILSGAVSKGKFDFLPTVLDQLGMRTIFHSVTQRPGKPFLFGAFDGGPLVFAFPGNPISTLVCFHQYFLPWLSASLRKESKKKMVILEEAIDFKPNLTLHQLVYIRYLDGKLMAVPVKNSGSGDMVSVLQADGIISLPAEKSHFNQGDVFELIEF